MSLAVASLQAKKEIDLDAILQAIQNSNLPDAQRQLEPLNLSTKNSADRQELLEELKDKATSVDQRQNITKLALGSLILLGSSLGTTFAQRSDWYNRNTSVYPRDLVYYCLFGARVLAALFIKDGISGLFFKDGSSKSARVREYFEDLANIE